MPAVYRICLETAASGRDASGRYTDPDLVGHVFAGPYLFADSAFGFVAVDDDGVAGYILAAADTEAFEDWAERHWWPALRDRYRLPSGTGGGAGTGTTNDATMIERIHHPHRSDAVLLADHPAHLHIDLLPRLQGTGAGRRLMDTVIDESFDRGVPGVFLGVGKDNAHAAGFYRHLGFTTLAEDADTLWLGLATATGTTGRTGTTPNVGADH